VNVNLRPDAEAVRSFKMSVTSSQPRRAVTELHEIIEKTLRSRLQRVDTSPPTAVREKIDLELPSDLTLMNSVLE
jgi:hypothetical protein